MKRAIKAALLSGLVFPGLGQIYLKKYKQGLLIITFAILGFAVIVGTLTAGALASLKAIQVAGGTLDTKTASNLASIDYAHSGIYMKLAVVLVLCCWLFSVIDAFRSGKKSVPGGEDVK